MTLFHYMAWIRPYRRTLLAGLVFVLAGGVLTLLAPWFLRQGVAKLPDIQAAPWAGLALVLLGRAVLGFAGAGLLGRVAARAITDLRQQLFTAFLGATVPFHDRNWSADLAATLTSDATYIQETLGGFLPTLAQHLPVAAAAMILLFVENWALALGLTVVGAPVVFFCLFAGRALRRLARDGQACLGQMAVVAQESFLGIRMIKILGQEVFFTARFAAIADGHYGLKRRRVVWLAALEGLAPVAAVVGLFWGLWIGHDQLVTGRKTVAQLVSFGAYLAILGTSLVALVRAFSAVEHVAGALQRIGELGATAGEREAQTGCSLARLDGSISFESVTFEYPEGRRGVHDINLQVHPGEFVAILGPNGAGKSTLVHLLLRFYRPQQGRILLGGHSAEEVNIVDWRRQFAIVTRDPVIFSVSATENIRLGRAGAAREEIEAAARLVKMHEFLQSMPGGYDSPVGEQGIRLSAGQRQRLALARVFLQDPAVVIFDEATASLDQESEAALADAVNAWAGRRTVIVISHQPVDHWPVTRVIRLEAGRLVQERNRRLGPRAENLLSTENPGSR